MKRVKAGMLRAIEKVSVRPLLQHSLPLHDTIITTTRPPTVELSERECLICCRFGRATLEADALFTLSIVLEPFLVRRTRKVSIVFQISMPRADKNIQEGDREHTIYK